MKLFLEQLKLSELYQQETVHTDNLRGPVKNIDQVVRFGDEP